MSDQMIRVAVGWNDDGDCHYVYPCNEGEQDVEAGLFEALIPTALHDQLLAASKAYDVAIGLIVDIAEIDENKLRVICPEWVGEHYPTLVVWQLCVPPSGSDDKWPAGGRSVSLRTFDTEAEAIEFRSGMPDHFAVLLGGGGFIVDVDRDTLEINHHTIGGHRYRCTRCGHGYEAHQRADDHQGLTDEDGGDDD